jgi:hypothetical protein
VPALRLALVAWTRNPRELGLLNLLAVLAAVLPLPALAWLPAGPLRWIGLVTGLSWIWLCFCALAAGCALALDQALRRQALWAWIKAQALEQVAWLLAVVLLWLWIALALRFYLALGLPAWLSIPVLALLGSLALWSLLALLASAAVGALRPPKRRARLKAAALLPLAYGPSLLGAALLGFLLSGLPALLVGLKHWSAPLLFAPLALAPLFTAALYAAYLVLLVRGLAEQAAGAEAPQAPDWREIWNPWR